MKPVNDPGKQRAQHTVTLDVVELVEDVRQLPVELLGQDTVEMSGPARDGGDEDESSGSHDASRLAQCLQSVVASLQVVELVVEQRTPFVAASHP